jgi:exopolysaccharide biosynthesis operon protein EpsL
VDRGEILLPETDGTGERRGGTRNGWLRCSKYCLPSLLIIALVAGLTPSTAAYALWGDRLELFVAQARIRDDNVFRISSQSDPVVVLGTSSKGDVYHTTSFGFNFDVPLSRQRFLGGLSWDDHRYDRFSVLDFRDRHGRAVWQWRAGSRLSGELGYAEERALASLANVQSGVQSSTPNPLETQRTYINATYLLTPRWQLHGELSRLDQSNEVPVFRANDISIDSVDVTVSLVSPANNEIGLGVKVDDAGFPTLQSVGGSLIDNAYRQYRVAAITDLTLTGRSHVNARAGWISRSYDQLPERDFTGTTYHAAYNWMATGKLKISAIAQRDISATEQITTSFVLVKSVALRPTLRLTEKIKVSGDLEYSAREYLGDPGLELGTVSARKDQVRSVELMASYQPVRPVRLDMVLRRESRSSTAAFGDYVVDIIGVRARLAF